MIRTGIGLAAAALLFGGAARAQEPQLGFDEALRIGEAAVRTARAEHRAVSVAVVNREGRTLVALRMDGTSFVNLDLAVAKAVTAAVLGAPTMAIQQAVDSGKASFLSVPGITAVGGGVPVERGGRTVGGIGISGSTAEQDEALASAAAKDTPAARR